MGVALMTHVPNNFVLGCVENGMQSNCQLNNAQSRTQVTAGLRYRRDRLRPQFLRHAHEFGIRKLFEIRGTVHTVQKRGIRAVRHITCPLGRKLRATLNHKTRNITQMTRIASEDR